MKHFAALRLLAFALGILLVATSAHAGTTPAGKRPASRRARPALPTTKVPVPCCGTVPAPSPKPTAAATAQAVAAGLPSAPAAPQTVQLKGIVLAPDGRPCAGASVYPAGAPRQLVVTDAQGAFTLPVPAGAPLALRVEYFGEGSSRVEVATPGAEPLRITLGK